MKKLFVLLAVLVLSLVFGACGNDEFVITVGATPTPHAEILNSDAVKSYVESKGYKLNVLVYKDYVTPNSALADKDLDANYFQHANYLADEIAQKGYKILNVANIHYEPLNLYGKDKPESWEGKTINIINDLSNAERALILLKDANLITSYTMEGFNPSNPMANIESELVTIECLDAGLLAAKVNEGGYSVIPGNYALTAWNAKGASEYKILGESEEVAAVSANLICVREDNKDSEKVKILVEALGQESVAKFIEDTYGPTVVYYYQNLLK